MRPAKYHLILSSAHMLLLFLALGCSSHEASTLAAAPTFTADSSAIQNELDAMEPKLRTQVFREIGALSPESYYQFLAKHIDNEPFLLDGRLVVGLRDQFVASHDIIAAWGSRASSMAEVWRLLKVNPQAGKLGLVDYIFNHNGPNCQKQLGQLAETFGVSASSLAVAYSKVRNAPPGEASASTDGRYISKVQAFVGDLAVIRTGASASAYGLTLQSRKTGATANMKDKLGFSTPIFLKNCMMDPARDPRIVLGPNLSDENHSIQIAVPEQLSEAEF